MIKFLIVFFFILTNSSFSQVKKVNIIGNSRVNSNTIESLVDKKITNIDSIYINNLTKKIYDTEFFSDVRISLDQENLIISVVENPIVNFFYIYGITGSDLDEVNKIFLLKENTIFSSSKLKKNIESSLEYFKLRGFYSATINPEVIKIDNNQVNLIINIDKKEISKIQNIYFIGNKLFNSSQLLDVITSAEDGWWKLFSSSALSEQKVEYDKILLKDFYKSKGFYDAQIETASANIDSHGKFNLTFSINAGKKYKFDNIDIKANSALFKEEDILEIKNISNKVLKNQFYSSLTIAKLNKQITSYLESKRYSGFELNIQEDKKNDEIINVFIQISEEQKALIDKINIKGNLVSEEKTIRDNMIIAEGDHLNTTKIKKSIDNLKSKQLFSKVDYNLEDSNNKNYKNLNIIIKEQPTGSIGAGIGYGTSGGILEASINEKNFLGQGINLNFTGRLATEKISGDFSYVDPNFHNSNKELASSIFSEVDDYKNSGYQNKRVGTKLATKYEIYEDIYFRPNISLQFDKLDVTESTSSLLKSREGSFYTSSFGYNFFIDQRDSKFNPNSGLIFYFDQNIATLVSDIPTIQTGIGATFYKELVNDKFIGSAKFKLANVTAFDNKDVKLSDRLYSTPGDLRGFEYRGVGPVDSGDHIGGNNLATISLKSTFPNPLPDGLRANTFLFYDIGNVWGVDYSDFISESSKIRSSTGLALDVMSPLGPISFTYSIPISKSSTDKEQRFLFNIGSSF